MKGLTAIALDWGTTHLRAYALGAGGVLARAESDAGMGALGRSGYEEEILRLCGGWLGPSAVPVYVCGMAGSRQGWHEAPYRAVPCAPVAPGSLTRVPTRDARLEVWLVPGLKQTKPADVMRGEETQIAGALAREPGFDGVLCLPGTHSKWVHVSAGEVVSFRTFLTGEMFALLAGQSVLRHALGAEADLAAFDAAVSDALARPEALAARLFSIRAESLIADLSPEAARGRLSGLLIGAELAACKPYWLGQPVRVIGAAALSALYMRALAGLGVSAQAISGEDCVVAGLARFAAQREAAE